jgi:hypothetical protein
MDNIIAEINREIKEHLKNQIDNTLIQLIEKNCKGKEPLEALSSLSDLAEKHLKDSELVKDISNIHEIVKLNLVFNQAGK